MWAGECRRKYRSGSIAKTPAPLSTEPPHRFSNRGCRVYVSWFPQFAWHTPNALLEPMGLAWSRSRGKTKNLLAVLTPEPEIVII